MTRCQNEVNGTKCDSIVRLVDDLLSPKYYACFNGHITYVDRLPSQGTKPQDGMPKKTRLKVAIKQMERALIVLATWPIVKNRYYTIGEIVSQIDVNREHLLHWRLKRRAPSKMFQKDGIGRKLIHHLKVSLPLLNH